MPSAWHNLAQWTLLSAGMALVACGGQAKSDGSDTGAGVTCEYGGETYEPGDDFPAADGCNSCTCGDDGNVGCTLVDCPSTGCEYAGVHYELFESFPAGDGCNTCTCRDDGDVGCTMVACPTMGCEYGGVHYELFERFEAGDGCNSCICHETGITCGTAPCERCDTIENEYAGLRDAAKRCNPDIDVEQCTQSISIGLACSCPSFVNPENTDAIAELESATAEYQGSACSNGIVCGMCAVPVQGACSAAGLCEDLFTE